MVILIVIGLDTQCEVLLIVVYDFENIQVLPDSADAENL